MSYFANIKTGGVQSSTNNSTTPLNAGATFTGTAELNSYSDVQVSCITDQNGTLYFDFSVDGTNWNTFPTSGFTVAAGIHEIHNAVEAGEIIVAGADTGTVYYSYLASATSTDYVFGSKAVAGAGTYALGHDIWRCNFAYFVSNSPTTTNVGNITIRNTVTTANVFCVIPATYGQSYCAAYTVPFGCAVYIDRITGGLRGSSTGSLDGFFWYRESGGGGFRLRFPFELQYGGIYFDDVDYLIRIPSGVDFIPRIVTASANNLSAKLSYRLIKVTP
jgi:hypothetical protein